MFLLYFPQKYVEEEKESNLRTHTHFFDKHGKGLSVKIRAPNEVNSESVKKGKSLKFL